MTKLLVFIIFWCACICVANAQQASVFTPPDENNREEYFSQAAELASRRYYSYRNNQYPQQYRDNQYNYGNNDNMGYMYNRAKKSQVQLPSNIAFNSIQSFNRPPYTRTSRINKNHNFQFFKPQPKPTKKCGLMKPQVRSYVANGKSTTHSDWPWYVQIIIKSDAEAYCGGTIISDNYILTAAHCFDEIRKENLASSTTVLLKGVRIKNEYNKKYDEVIVKSKSVHLHPYYVPAMTQHDADELGIEPGPKNDIAIIRIEIGDQKVVDQIVPACLPANSYQIPINAKCKIMGHGFIDAKSEDNFIMPRFLQMADVRISRNDICKQEVDSEVIRSKINDDTLCIRGAIHPCVGDSGGPLVCKGTEPHSILGETSNSYDYESSSQEDESEWYLTGVTSFAVSTDLNDKCGLFKSAVFGKVANHMEWIRQITRI